MRPSVWPVWILGCCVACTGAGAGDVTEVRDEVWGIEFRVPDYEPWDDHPLQGQPNFVLAGASSSDACELNFSVFAEIIPPETSADDCRKGYLGNPEPLEKSDDVDGLEHETEPLTYTLFRRTIVEVFTEHKLYGYWTRNDTCFELHISSVGCDDFGGRALPILKSVKLGPDRGVTVETVALASTQGRHPTDWEIHLAAASHYLHQAEPPVPERARRFFSSTIELAGEELDDEHRWIIEEGIGIAWLMEDDGDAAIPPLSRALELARAQPDRDQMLSSTLYNLSCAYSLTGDVEQACVLIGELLSTQPDDERKESLKEIRQDPQLKAVRKAACFKALKKG